MIMATEIKAEQRSDEWFAARLGRPTASRFSDIMSKTRSGYAASRKNYAAQLIIEQITGQPTEGYTSAAMQHGVDYEDTARLSYELESGNEVTETSLWLHDEIETGASPDGFINHDGVLEIKCPNSAIHLETLHTGKIPRQYYAQVQGQMWITDRKWCDFVSYDPRMPDNAQMIIIRVDRDDDYIAELEAEIRAFIAEVEEEVEFVNNYKKGSNEL